MYSYSWTESYNAHLCNYGGLAWNVCRSKDLAVVVMRVFGSILLLLLSKRAIITIIIYFFYRLQDWWKCLINDSFSRTPR